MAREETIKYFVETASKDFSFLEANLENIISEVKETISKGLNYIEEFDEIDERRIER